MKPAITAAGAVAAAAVAGSVASRPGSDWYRRLRKPSWQPPPAAFPLVWTPLYAAIAASGSRALSRAGHGRPDGHRQQAAVLRRLLLDMALNAAWTALFFQARRPRAALADLILLDAANVALARRTWQADRLAGALLVPYTAWCAFATALNAEIVRLNPGA